MTNEQEPPPLAQGKRVVLRRLSAEHGPEFLSLRRASADFHRVWDPLPAPGEDPYGQAAFERLLASGREPSCERTLVCSRVDGDILGAVNFNNIVRGAFQSCFLGYWVGAAHARKGYMREGLGLALEHGFGALCLHRMEANIQPHNEASLALVRGLGFRREGYSPRYLKIYGEWRDHERWALLVEDWRQRT